MTGTFITFEGGDGVGKSTQVTLLVGWLTSLGHEVVRTYEPGATALGAAIREILLHADYPVDAKAEAFLYAADRAQHIGEIVRPALERGAVVVQDRYIDSSLAYQGAGRVLGADDIQGMSEWATGGLWPDLTVLLDAPVAVARQRIRGRAQTDRLEREDLEFHEQVRQGFLRIAEATPERTVVVDATGTPEQISEQIRRMVSDVLDRQR